MHTQHGLLLIDKISGISSHDVVARARRILGTRAIGHSGTLDPMASGLMVLLMNEATKLSHYILEQDKEYIVRAQLGVITDTLDVTGEILERRSVDVSSQKLEQAALSLRGDFEWNVPMYSAAKVDGKKLYEYAREGKTIEVPKKTMSFLEVEVKGTGPDWLEARIRCSKGSFIRTWVHELGQNLGTGAAMSALRRTFSAPYSLEHAVTLEQLEVLLAKQDGLSGVSAFIPMAATLPTWKVLRVKGQDRVLLSNGSISHDLRTQLIAQFHPEFDQGVKILDQESGELMALIGLEPGKGFQIRRVFKYS